jgi:hypothetical protein
MSLPTHHQIAHAKSAPFEGKLVCPYCQHIFPLTWQRYWAAPLGGHRCPQCQRTSHFKDHSVWVWPIRIAGILVGGILFLTVSAYIFNNVAIGTLFFVMGGLFVGLPVDKWLDGHLRRLQIG